MRSANMVQSFIPVVSPATASHKPRRSKRERRVLLAAAGAMVLASSAMAQSLYFDVNGTTSGVGSGAGTWSSSVADWNTASAGTATPVNWVSGDIANFNAAFTVQLLDAETIGGINFNTGATTITTAAGTTGEALNIGTSTYNTTAATGGYAITTAVAGREIIAVPIVGSGDLVLTSGQNNTSNTIDFAGNMSQFTGSMYLNDKASFGSGIVVGAQFQLDSPTGGTGTIYLDQNVGFTTNNQIGSPTGVTETGGNVTGVFSGTYGDYSTGTLVAATPNIFTISNPMVLNYKGVSGSEGDTIGAANGPTIGGVKYQKIVTYSGNISSPSGVNSNLIIGGTNGTTVLSGNNTYTGNTYAAYSNSNGFLQLGSATALPATTTLVFGNNISSATGSVGPVDLSGNNINIAGLQTGSSGTTATAVGNIYNLQIVNTSYPVMANGQPSGTSGVGYQTNPNSNASTITITPVNAQSTVFNGDIGDSNDSYGTGVTLAPFTNNAPYSSGTANGADYVHAQTNVSLVLNGPTNGGNGILTLAPIDTYSGGTVTGLTNGNEYAGTTTVNSNATLVLGRGFDKQTPASFTGALGTATPPTNYTLTGGGNVVVNNGGTLASLSSAAGFSIGGSAATIVLNSGSSFLPGQGVISGTQGAKGTTTTLSPNNIGTFSTNAIQFNAGASMTFSIANASSYDYVYLYGNLSLDDPSNSNHTINIDVTSTGTLTPGVYDLINANSIPGTASSYTLNTSSLPASYANDIFSLSINSGYLLQLNVQAPLLQWDPSGTGSTNHSNGGDVTEEGGVWTDGVTPFYNALNGTETTWSNSSTYEVLIGDDATQHGGVITLGSNIVASSGIEFGPIAAGANYSIQNSSGNSYTLTIGSGGIQVANAAATYNGTTLVTPSAEIDVPVILSASQTWNVSTGQFLNVTGAITQSTAGTTLTVTGGGDTEFGGANGNIGTLSVTGGSLVILGSSTAIGNAAVNLNGGGVEFSVNGSPTNAITIGANGGGIGATAGFNTIYSPNISTANGIEAIGAGGITFQGSVTAGALQVATTGSGIATFNSPVTVSGNLSATGGTAHFKSSVSVTGTSSFTGGSTYLDNSSGANTFTGGITIAGGTVYAQSSNALGNATITFPGSPTGGLDIAGAATLSNPLNGTGSGATTGGNSYGDTVFIDSTHAFTLTGSTEGTGDLRFYADPNNAGGVTPQITFDEASTRPGGGAVYYNIPNLTIVIPNDPSVNVAAALGLSTQSFMSSFNTTIDVETPYTVAGDLRGESNTTGGANILAVTKTGPGTLALSGSAGSSTPGTLIINNGEVQVPSNTALGGQTPSSTSTPPIPVVGVVVNNTGVLGLDYNGRVSGFTLNNGGTLRRDNTYYSENSTTFVVSPTTMAFEVDMSAGSASDVINVTGTGGTIEDAAQEGSNSANTSTTNELFTIQNPILVNTGATLNLQNDNPVFNGTTGGYDTSYILALRGPTTATNTYETLTIQAGAKVVNTGPGQVRFGRTNSGGIPIIGQGTAGSEAVFRVGSTGGDDDVYMTDNAVVSTSNFNTMLVVNSTVGSTAGLRIEAPMDATYEDPTSATATPGAQEGTTGLFGINTTGTSGTLPAGLAAGYYGSIGNAFTVATPNRLAALSSVYTYTDANSVVHTITPAGTLTLAANDSVSATGTILGGPAGSTVSNVALALDNTSIANTGTLTYQIDPAANSAGGTFANFASLTVERAHAGGAGVTAQLVGNTLVHALSITGGAKMDITNQALVVDPLSGSAPTAQIAAYLKSAYDSGNWDAAGIGSSSVASVRGTSIGYAENDLLPTPYSATNLFGGASGQAVDASAVLVRYTWLGDLNLDGVVDSSDLSMMGDGQAGWIGGDLNYDGVVNADDYALFQLGAAAQTGQLTSAVPEPATMSLLAIGAGALLRRRRH